MKDHELHLSQYIVRTPLHSTRTLQTFSEGLRAASTEPGTPEAAAAAIEGDRVVLRQRLRRWLSDPVVQEALYLAAPGLLQSVGAWRRDPDSKSGRAIERTLVRYLARMSTRCTPFGLFSGLTVGTLASQTRASLGSERRRFVVLDAELLSAVARNAASDRASWARTRLFTNSTVNETGAALRFVRRLPGDARRAEFTSAARDPILDAVLDRARTGATGGELVATVTTAEPDAEPDEATAYIRELEASGLLVSELEPPLTGRLPTLELAETLRRVESPLGESLSTAERALRSLDPVPLGAALDPYDRIRDDMQSVLGEPARHVFHAQLHTEGDIELGEDVTSRLLRTVDALRSAFPPPDPLAAFRDKFEARYGRDRFVSLSEALDEDSGIGFGAHGADPSALLRQIPLPLSMAGGRGRPTLAVRPAAVRTWARAMERGTTEVAVTSSELRRWTPAAQSAPPARQSFAVFFTLGRAEASDEAEIVFKGTHGPSAIANAGRFAHAHPAVQRLVRAHAAKEQEGLDAVLAEVVHLPSERLRNVTGRPVLRDYEIPCLARSGAPVERQIPISDLQVGVVNDRIELRSRSLDKRVIPRLASAHNSPNSPVPTYRFLGALELHDACMATAWRWGDLGQIASFLPRVRLDGVVVAKARWRVHAGALKPVRRAKTPQERFDAVQRIRRTHQLPRYVQHGRGDVQLTVDLDNTLSIDAFVHEIHRGQSAVTLTECYPRPDRHFVRGDDGPHASEYCLPVLRTGELPVPRTPAPAASTAATRTFGPGSEWLFLKAFGGKVGTETTLLDAFAPALGQLESEGLIDRWFFVRYGDPDWHLRLRLHGDPKRLVGVPLARMLDIAEGQRRRGRLWKVELCPYEREVRRFGGDAAIHLAEQIFHADSVAAVELLREVRTDPDRRWRLVLLSMDRMLADLGLDLSSRLEAMRKVGNHYMRSFDPRRVQQKAFSAHYRAERDDIEALLAGDAPKAALATLARRSRICRPLAAQMRRVELATTIESVAHSMLHMHANRMFRSAANAQECVLYEFLRRTYRSQLARTTREGAA
ncbi:MAG: lantibiotic dehydratase [Myxococcota bacterium]